MKRVATLALVSLALLGACSTDDGNAADNSASPTAADPRKYVLEDGTTIEYDRLGELPQNMAEELQGRFDKVLFEPNVEKYQAALVAKKLGPDTDNLLAFKAEAGNIGSETGKYVGGVIRAVATCEDESLKVMWGFAPQDKNTAQFADCSVADSKAEAHKLAQTYLDGAIGGREAWVLIEQKSSEK
ncbi:hypothetical protein [Timonella sp. A28]|uniref:hypothetical protein n=1 Tax=Timonella sp. A28 TaxID=3442640 RepID=UPI003EBD378A